jgi:microcin C transport system substrate-binding protein
MNMRKAPFDDLKVRMALAHLLDRNKMNATLMHNQYFLHRSYYEDLYGPDHPCGNPLIAFDKDAARKLLKEAGWVANPKTGFLEKGGQPFLIKFLTRSASSDKFLVIFKEDLKDVGIDLEIDKKDWAAWARDMDEFNFDMTWAAWGAGVWRDPESMWHSKEAKRPSGNNITGFESDRVDALIEKQRAIFDIGERNEILREIDGIVTREVPYVLLWNINYTRLLYWNKFGMPDTVLDRYGDEDSAYSYWWLDYDSEADLEESMETEATLPAKSFKVEFDQTFTGRVEPRL